VEAKSTIELVEIPAGWFLMGSETGQENEQPVHRVWIDDFGLGRYPVTNREYSMFLEQTQIAAPRFWAEPMFPTGEAGGRLELGGRDGFL
jgi:formylglycine-generating enzyme required for sulfatase activity